MLDGSAEVKIFADSGQLTTLSGRDASWRQYQGSARCAHIPIDFRLFAGEAKAACAYCANHAPITDGRWFVIDDPQAGAARYRFDFNGKDLAAEDGRLDVEGAAADFPCHKGLAGLRYRTT
jgi:hypothetical protein